MKDLLSDFDSRLFDILSKSNSNMFFYCKDMKNNVAHWSESAKDYFSLPSTRLSPASLWADRIHPDDIKGHDKKIEALTSGETPYLNCEYRIMNKAGDYIWANCRGYMTYDEDGAPQVMAGYVCNMGQITKIDPGTGMWNAYAFRNNLSAMLERGESGVAMMIDIRNFKRINAKFGYDFGDTVLYTIGHRLLDICEKRATVYRVAGTQFAMFMSGGREEAISLWSDIEEYVQNITVGGKKINIHFVTGVTFFPQDGQHFDQINSNLTYTVAAAKQAERKDIVYYSGELVMQRNRLVRMNEALQNSITNGFKGFSIVFQPVIDASTGAQRKDYPRRKMGRGRSTQICIEMEQFRYAA